MARAILIMEMPSSCEECQLFYNTEGTKMCEAIGRLVECESEKPTWCPLRKCPQYKPLDVDGISEFYAHIGFNQCLNEILGGGE